MPPREKCVGKHNIVEVSARRTRASAASQRKTDGSISSRLLGCYHSGGLYMHRMQWNNANGGTQTGIAEQRRCGLTTYGHDLGLSLHNARGDRPEVRADLMHTSKDKESVNFDVFGGRSRIGWRSTDEHASDGWGIGR